ncbi:MAG: ATP-binding protein [Parachlamydia sp.]|nr:ATP-binding protein [Parachlamydia sp.]
MSDSQSKFFFASLQHLHEMLAWIRDESRRVGFTKADLYKIELAAEEAIVNVIHYSYSDAGGEIEIAVRTDVQREVQIVISDNGRSFNPLVHKPKDNLNVSLAEMEVGGLGIIFMRKCMDEVIYQRLNNQNILTLIKKTVSY